LFLKKLLKEGNENTLKLFQNFPEYSTPLSIHLISQYESKGIVQPKNYLSLIRYQLMTEQIFEQFLSLFKQTGSDVAQRQLNSPLFIQCAINSNQVFIEKVFQFIAKRFLNEQLIVIEQFLRSLSLLNDQSHLLILPNYFESIENIINIALNHLQQSTNTLQIIINYGIFLLKSTEHSSNLQQKQQIQTFATKIIKQ
jgi:hypothetical protein